VSPYIDGNNTADAAALALAINRHPSLSGRLRAVSNAAIVYIGHVNNAPGPNDRVLTPLDSAGAVSTTITVNYGVPTASASCMVLSLRSNLEQNFIPIALDGTGMTVATNGSSGFLGGATGGGRVDQRLVGQP
jgi:hypothetical protein